MTNRRVALALEVLGAMFFVWAGLTIDVTLGLLLLGGLAFLAAWTITSERG